MKLEKLFEISEELKQNSYKIQESLLDCEEQIDASSNKAKNFSNNITIKSDELSEFIKKERNLNKQFFTMVDENGEKNYQYIANKCTEFKKIHANTEMDINEHSKTTISKVKDTISLICDQLDSNVKEALLVSLKNKKDCLNEFKLKTFDQTAYMNVFIELFTQLTSQNDDTILELLKQMQNYCGAYLSSLDHVVNDGNTSCQNYCENGFMKYTPTGETPKKITYSYPQQFACTSPHDIIIARFKASLNKQSVDK